jgi:hypothetical protein
LDIWVGENHFTPQGNYLAINLNAEIKFQNFIKEGVNAHVNQIPSSVLCLCSDSIFAVLGFCLCQR